MSPTEASHDREGCPPLEDIAAYIDGTLGEDERTRLTEHLASCEDCFEIFSETVRFQQDTAPPLQDEARGALPFPFERADSSLPSPAPPVVGAKPRSSKRVRRSSRGAFLAAAAVLAVLIGFFTYRTLTVRPEAGAAELVQLGPGTGPIEDRLWTGRITRGHGSEDFESDEDCRNSSFCFGVQATDLAASLQVNDPGGAEGSLQRLAALLREEALLGYIERSYASLRTDIKPSQKEPSPIADRAKEFADRASATENDLREGLDPLYFDLGKWVEAGRLAASLKRPEFFNARQTRRFARWFLRQKKEMDTEVLTEIEAIQEIVDRGPLQDSDYTGLTERFETILRTYYPDH